MKALVVAHYREELGWLDKVDREKWRVSVVTDLTDMVGFWRGRESTSYLKWIVYENFLSFSEIVLCQANPFDHDAHFLDHLDGNDIAFGRIEQCSPNGLPHCDWTPMHSWADVLALPCKPSYRFAAGAQYRITPAQLMRHPMWFWEALYQLTHLNNKSAWVLERLWPQLFGYDDL